ncbi:MAG: hypothetical protein Pg6A_02610 [Termitinemataceae bacterium]|nr:MAG: hypothetical protein Pg6A_02610 [Termitinemataceae bacterium]
MIVASIDLQGGKVVQLVQGQKKALERSDAAALARDFNLYGEIAVIDLDAAMGKGSNIDIIKPLLSLASCRVGGGIRSADQAVELVSLGAQKIIVGSKAFVKTENGFDINNAFLEELVCKIGRERLIVAIDSRDGIICMEGWTRSTGLPLIKTAAALERFAGELLWTCVEREGTLTGISLDAARELRGAVSCLLTVAGGVSTLSEVETLAQSGCDVQLGMALYTGKIDLKDAFIASLNWNKGIEASAFNASESAAERAASSGIKDGAAKKLLPVIAQDEFGQILMTGWTDREALSETFKRGNLCFWSRTRAKLWMKGETSGNTLRLLRLRADCDRDALLAAVSPAGPVCHTGSWSCFETGRSYSFALLSRIIDERLKNAPPDSYTASLSLEKIKRKVMEEAFELCTAKSREETVWEAADLFFHALLFIVKQEISLEEVLAELERRHKENHANKKRFQSPAGA